MKIRILFALLLLPAWSTLAADDDYIEQDSLKRVEFEVALRTQLAVNKQLNRVIYAEEIGWSPPIHPPKLTFDQVYARIEEVVEREANKDDKYPKSFYENIKIEAKQRYRMWKAGDQGETVSVTVRIHGQNKVHTGVLRAITRDRIIVGSTPLAKRDLSKEDLTHLYWEEHEAAVNRYIRIKTEQFEAARTEFKEGIRQKVGKKEWPRFGFVWNNGPKEWQSRAGAFEKQYQAKFASLYKTLSEEIANTVYAEFGFIFNEETQQWQYKGTGPSPDELEKEKTNSLLRRVVALFSRDEPDPIDAVLDIDAPTAPPEEDSLWEDDVESGARPAKLREDSTAPAQEGEGGGDAPAEGATPQNTPAGGAPPVEDVSDLYDEKY